MKQTTDDSNEEECGNRRDRARRDVEALKDSLLLPSAISYGHVVFFFLLFLQSSSLAARGARPDPVDDTEAVEGAEIMEAGALVTGLAWRLAKLDSERRRVSTMALAAPDDAGTPSTLEWERAWLMLFEPPLPGRCWLNKVVPNFGLGGSTVGLGPIFRPGSSTNGLAAITGFLLLLAAAPTTGSAAGTTGATVGAGESGTTHNGVALVGISWLESPLHVGL